MSRRSSNLMTLRMSSICVSRSIDGLARCSRSPIPVWVGVTRRCPAAAISGCIFFHAHPADQAPWQTRKVAPMIFPHWLSRLERYKAQKPMLANSATSNSASEILSDEHDRISASVSRRARRRLRDRPRRLRDGTRGAGDLALRVAAFNRGAVGPDLFDRRADLNAPSFWRSFDFKLVW